MILHIADDEKFLDHSIAVFEAVHPDKNIYLINKNTALEYIKTSHKNIICHEYGSSKYAMVIEDYHNIEAVIFHDLIHNYKWNLVHEFSKQTHIHWMCYGSELYNIPSLRKNLFLPLTKSVVTKNRRTSAIDWVEKKIPLVYNFIYQALKNDSTQFVKFKNAVMRCNSFSSPIADELIYVKKHLNPTIEYISFEHGTFEKLTHHVKDMICSQQDFLVGNSANPSNNHLDTFKTLNKIDFYQNVYVPLSYPKNDAYIALVKSKGEAIFGNQFKALTEFMSMSEYCNVLKCCGNVILNFNRQQGMGNIIIALYLGAKVYLNNQNISFNYLKKLGLKIYHIDELENTYKLENHQELAMHNRKILKKIYGEQTVLDATRNLVCRLENSQL